MATTRRDYLPESIAPHHTRTCRKCKGSGLFERGHVCGDCFACGGTGEWRYYDVDSPAVRQHDAEQAWNVARVHRLMLGGGYERELRHATHEAGLASFGPEGQATRALTRRCSFWLTLNA